MVRRDFLVACAGFLVQACAGSDAAAARAAGRRAGLGRAGAEGRLAGEAGGRGGEGAEGLAEAAALEVAGCAGGGFAVARDVVAVMMDVDRGRVAAGGAGRGGAEVVAGCEEGVVGLQGVYDAWGAGAVACGWGVGDTGEAGVGDCGGGAGVAGEGV